MSVYKRGKTWWYKFYFAGQFFRESAKTKSKTVAGKAEEARKRQLENSYNRIPQKKTPVLFSTAASEWLETKKSKASKTVLGYEQRMKPVVAAFGGWLLFDIGVDDILAYWSARQKAGASNRTINYETCCLRGVLRRHDCGSVSRSSFKHAT